MDLCVYTALDALNMAMMNVDRVSDDGNVFMSKQSRVWPFILGNWVQCIICIFNCPGYNSQLRIITPDVTMQMQGGQLVRRMAHHYSDEIMGPMLTMSRVIVMRSVMA